MIVTIAHKGRSVDQIAQIVYEGTMWGGILMPPETPGITKIRFLNENSGQEFSDSIPVGDLEDNNEKE